VDSKRQFSSSEVFQPDTPAPPNRIAAAPSGLKVVGRRECTNVIGNQCKAKNTKNIILEVRLWRRIIYKEFLRLKFMSHDPREYMNKLKCVTGTKQIRKESRSMSSFTPMSVAMKFFDNPTTENKQVRDYVNQFVSRLTI
jgi:hypothetical protein